jgi:formylmethanofuran dehydrogenase subunit E
MSDLNVSRNIFLIISSGDIIFKTVTFNIKNTIFLCGEYLYLSMKWHEHCQYMEIPRDYSLLELARFHGHLGPYIVLGYRMGRYALSRFGDNPFALSARVYCSGTTPQSCLADGVQLGSGCTLGKGNIELIISEQVCCEFTHESGTIRLTPNPQKTFSTDIPDYECRIEEYASSLYSLPDEELFTVQESV